MGEYADATADVQGRRSAGQTVRWGEARSLAGRYDKTERKPGDIGGCPLWGRGELAPSSAFRGGAC